jgi:hypothetical protein
MISLLRLLSIVCLIQLVACGSITPIQTNPFPSWASSNDQCALIRTCDECPITNQQYCQYTENGQPKCCVSSEQPEQSFVASVTPILDDPIPEWATQNDQCMIINSCDQCQSTNVQYCRYSMNGQSSCCARSESTEQVVRMVAAIEPIKQDKPSAASESDKCVVVNTCDSCESTNNQYCFYNMMGQAKCCQLQSQQPEATVTPITENPIPSWASDNDTCVRKRSCDNCLFGQYCRYNQRGVAKCCSSNSQPQSTPTAEVQVAFFSK